MAHESSETEHEVFNGTILPVVFSHEFERIQLVFGDQNLQSICCDPSLVLKADESKSKHMVDKQLNFVWILRGS